MVLDIHKLIATIAPEVFCQPTIDENDQQVNLIQRAKEGYKSASEKAKVREYAFMDLIDIANTNAVNAPGLKAPIEKHTLVYDSFGESLEPIYFWVLDRMGMLGIKPEKLVDNFVSSPGSGHFSEMRSEE